MVGVILHLGRLLDASPTVLGVLASSMSVAAGFAAAPELLRRRRSGPATALADKINTGLVAGFIVALPWAAVSLVVTLFG
jgi:hypothetical protein